MNHSWSHLSSLGSTQLNCCHYGAYRANQTQQPTLPSQVPIYSWVERSNCSVLLKDMSTTVAVGIRTYILTTRPSEHKSDALKPLGHGTPLHLYKGIYANDAGFLVLICVSYFVMVLWLKMCWCSISRGEILYIILIIYHIALVYVKVAVWYGTTGVWTLLPGTIQPWGAHAVISTVSSIKHKNHLNPRCGFPCLLLGEETQLQLSVCVLFKDKRQHGRPDDIGVRTRTLTTQPRERGALDLDHSAKSGSYRHIAWVSLAQLVYIYSYMHYACSDGPTLVASFWLQPWLDSIQFNSV